MAWKAIYIIYITVYIIVNFYCAIKIEENLNSIKRKQIFYFAIIFNFGILFFFKYFDFFSDNLNQLFAITQIEYRTSALNLILPMGISFYTFQIVSYVVDVYNRKLKAERHLGTFYLFITYFPQLVAGPIERAHNLISQLKDLRNRIDNAAVIAGLQQIILGFFKKIVIADRLSPYVDQVYSFPEGYSGLNIAIATFFFTIQIYCDFSGYTDIAIGSSRLLGVKLMDNFRTPYFSKSISEFWSRWHISLSTWFRDYVYIPLGGNRVVKWRWYYNIFITFAISGFWHGANWTYIFWGILHGSYLVLAIIALPITSKIDTIFFGKLPKLKTAINMLLTFILVYFTWIFFRAENINDAFFIFRKILMLKSDLGTFTVAIDNFGVFSFMVSLGLIGLLFLYEALLNLRLIRSNFRSDLFLSAMFFVLILLFGVMGSKSFIYFQF